MKKGQVSIILILGTVVIIAAVIFLVPGSLYDTTPDQGSVRYNVLIDMDAVISKSEPAQAHVQVLMETRGWSKQWIKGSTYYYIDNVLKGPSCSWSKSYNRAGAVGIISDCMIDLQPNDLDYGKHNLKVVAVAAQFSNIKNMIEDIGAVKNWNACTVEDPYLKGTCQGIDFVAENHQTFYIEKSGGGIPAINLNWWDKLMFWFKDIFTK